MKSLICAAAEKDDLLINFEIEEKDEIEALVKSVRISKGKFERTEIENQEELDKLFEELKSFTSFKECNIDYSTRSQKLNYEEMIDFLQVQFNIIQRNNRGR